MRNLVKFVCVVILAFGTLVVSVLGFDRFYGGIAGFDRIGLYALFPLFTVWMAIAVAFRRHLYLFPERKPPFFKDWRFWATIACLFIPVAFNQASHWAARASFDSLSNFLFAARYMAAGVVMTTVVVEIIYSQYFGNEL